MLRVFSIGFSQFLLFSAMVLMILTNVGQLTTNIVSRNIDIVHMKIADSTNILKSSSGLSTRLQAPQEVKWGLYNTCAYNGSDRPTCGKRGFGHYFDPVETLASDLGLTFTRGEQSFYEKDQRVSNLHTKSRAAFYLLFIGTIFAGIAFLITCLIHMSALVIAGMLAFVSFALLVAGAAIWTYIIHEFKKISSAPYMINYGDSLWFTWAAVGCLLFALPTLLSGSIASRRRYYEEPYY